MIKYKEALADLQLDLDCAGVGEERWSLIKAKQPLQAPTSNASHLNAAALS